MTKAERGFANMKLDEEHLFEPVIKEIQKVLSDVDEKQIDDVENSIRKNRRIFVLGIGRSGLMAKAFAMRLMQLGFKDYVVGETITPSIQKDDLLIAVSGSGKTSSVVSLAEKAKKQDTGIIAVTSNPHSPLADLATKVLIVPGATKTGEGIKSIQLLSSLFDQSVHIVLDILCLKISIRDHISNSKAKAEHSNME